MNFIDKSIERYCTDHTGAASPLLAELAEETLSNTVTPRMLTGPTEGQFLKMLVQLSQAQRVLEIGTFTGYSALSMAEGLPDNGQLITCEVDSLVEVIARRYFAKSPHGHKIDLRMGPALTTLSTLDEMFDLIFIDADKENYLNYYEAVVPKLRPGGLIVVDNTLWSGKVLNPQDATDKAIAHLNQRILHDARVENVLLTVRDGINLIRKR